MANTPEDVAFVEGLYALEPMAKPEEIASSALYLASDASSFTAGTALLVDVAFQLVEHNDIYTNYGFP